MDKFKTVKEYFSAVPSDKKKILKELREIILKSAPQAEEGISYNIPTLKLHGMLISYAAFKDHVSIFPGTAAVRKFSEELAGYEQSKGTVRFSTDKKLPAGLIARIVKFRIGENVMKAQLKRKRS